MKPAILFLAATALLAGMVLLAPAAQEPNHVDIKIDNFSFAPRTTTVPVGTVVTWTNNDDVPHTVVSADTTTFRSRPLDTGDHYSFPFSKKGTYKYFCSVHPRMTATIVVK